MGAYVSGKDYMTEPYSWEADGKTVTGVSFSSPIRDGSKVIGAAGGDILLTPLSEVLGQQRPLDTGSVHLLSQNGVWIAHADPAVLGKPWMEGQSEADLAVQTSFWRRSRTASLLPMTDIPTRLARKCTASSCRCM